MLMLSLGNTTWLVKAMLALCRTRLAPLWHHHYQGQSSHYHHPSCSYHQRLTSPNSSAPEGGKREWAEVSHHQTKAKRPQPVHPKRAARADTSKRAVHTRRWHGRERGRGRRAQGSTRAQARWGGVGGLHTHGAGVPGAIDR